MQVGDDVLAALDYRLLGGDAAVGGDAQLERRKERVRDLVGGEDDVVVLEQALREQVAERVVLLVEGEDGGVGDACASWISGCVGGGEDCGELTGLLLVLDLLLAVVEQEELEPVFSVVVSFVRYVTVILLVVAEAAGGIVFD